MYALELPDRNAQTSVKCLAINAMMNFTMAVRADASNALRGVGAAVGQPIDMMGLKVRHSRFGLKRRRLFARLAVSRRPREDVSLHVLTTSKYRSGLMPTIPRCRCAPSRQALAFRTRR